MSPRPKRRLVSEALAAADAEGSRDNVIALSHDDGNHETSSIGGAGSLEVPKARSEERKRGGIRHSYHTSLYLPEEAQFALREIALAMRYPKPHDVMLEAMADLFERYNKRELAEKIRARMSRDNVTKRMDEVIT